MIVDEDALVAGVNLVGRSGARQLEFGWLHDGVPIDQAAWWATATYRGAKVTVEGLAGPAEACEALARRILEGGECNHCHKAVTVGDGLALGTCRWLRQGPRWVRGCEPAGERP